MVIYCLKKHRPNGNTIRNHQYRRKKKTSAVATRIVLILYFLNNYYVISMASMGSVRTRKAIYFTFTFKMILYFKIKYGLVYYFNEMMRDSFGNTYKKTKQNEFNSMDYLECNTNHLKASFLFRWLFQRLFFVASKGCFVEFQMISQWKTVAVLIPTMALILKTNATAPRHWFDLILVLIFVLCCSTYSCSSIEIDSLLFCKSP